MLCRVAVERLFYVTSFGYASTSSSEYGTLVLCGSNGSDIGLHFVSSFWFVSFLSLGIGKVAVEVE